MKKPFRCLPMCQPICLSIVLTLFALGPGGAALAQCDLSPGMTNSVQFADGDLLISFGSDLTLVQPGQVVNFEFILTNKSEEVVTISCPVTGPDVLLVYPAWVADPLESGIPSVFHYPPVVFYVPGTITLEPGECWTNQYAWDTEAAPCLPGDYRAWAGLVAFPLEFEAPQWIAPAGGACLYLTVLDEVAAERTTLDSLKSQYR